MDNIVTVVHYYVLPFQQNPTSNLSRVRFFSDLQQNPRNTEPDARDLLQLALDRICELQRKLMQPNSCDVGSPREELTGRRF
jgi:hypothetical protein